MDFHSLPRRDLQALCKNNRIPANMTNLSMADALQALQTVEGISEIQEALQFQSPKKADQRSPKPPRTSQRTSVRRGPNREEPKEGQASPLPRARRVTAKASEIMRIVDEGEEGEKQEEIKEMPETLKAPTTRRRASKEEEGENQERPEEVPETPKAPTTRKRASKKEEGENQEVPKKVAETPALNTRRRAVRKEEKVEILDTPATRNGRRTSVRRVAETPKVEVEKEESMAGLKTYRRTTRQSSRKEPEEVTVDAVVNTGRRITRARAAVKMVDLAMDEEEKVVAGDASNEAYGDTVAESKDAVDQKKSGELLTEEEMKSMGTISDRCSGDLVVETEGSSETFYPTMDGDDKEEEKDVSGSIQEVLNVEDKGSDGKGDQPLECLGSAEETPEDDPKKEDEQHDPELKDKEQDDMSGFEGSPIRGLVSTEPSNPCNEIVTVGYEEAQIEVEEENGTPNDRDGEEEEGGSGGADLDFHLQESPLSNKIPAEIEDSSNQLPVNQALGDSALPQTNLEIAADATNEFSGEIPARGDHISLDGCGDLTGKEEEANLDLLLTGKILDSGNELVVNPRTDPDIPAANELHDEIPATSKIPTETMGSADDLNGEIQAETKGYSGDDLTSKIQVETEESTDDLTGEIQAEVHESSAGMLIGKMNSPESEIILSPLQPIPSPDPSKLSSSAARSPAKAPAVIGSPASVDPSLDSGNGFSESSENEERSVGIYRKESGDDKENSSGWALTEVTRMEVGPGGGETKVNAKAEKQNLQKAEITSLSLRKLRSLYKESLAEKVEGKKRSALKDLNENCL